MMMSSGLLKAAAGAIAFVMFIGLLLPVDSAENEGPTTVKSATTGSASATTGSFMESDILGRRRLAFHHDLNLNYISKRRVPNGPDPIHNRKAGNSRRPPGRG